MKDYINQRFGRIVVLSFSHRDAKSISYWNARCDCGKELVVRMNSLKTGNTSSCGCLARELTRQRFFKDLTGQRFGSLLVINHSHVTKSSSSQTTQHWNVLCDCGNELTVRGPHLQSGATMSCGCRLISKLHEKTRNILASFGLVFEEEYKLYQNLFYNQHHKKIPLRIDFFVDTPTQYVAVECQGEQHYRPIEFWGGEEGFKRSQERDAIKKSILRMLNIPLVEVKYDCPDIEIFLKQELFH